LVETPAFYPYLTGRRYLTLFARAETTAAHVLLRRLAWPSGRARLLQTDRARNARQRDLRRCVLDHRVGCFDTM
jgi:hypothetical protein